MDLKPLVQYKMKNVKSKRNIIDSIKDHVVPHIIGKDKYFDMWEAFTKLYQSYNENRKMVL